MSKLYACIISTDAKKDKAVLLSIAQQFSYGIEILEDGVLFDASGLENLVGGPEQLAQKILGLLEENNISGKVRIADTADTAILLAREESRYHPANTQGEFQNLLLQNLPIEDDTLKILNDLGIKKVRDLQKISADDLISRYGRGFKNVIDVIEQNGRRLLTPNFKEKSVIWSYDLDSPIDDFEQLIFVINHGLDILLRQVEHYGFSTDHLDISFKLRNTERNYEIKASFPTLAKTFWLKLANLRISLDPPEAEIVSVGIVSWFTRPRPDQRGLYAVSRPDSEDLLLTVNKIKKLVGEDNVGVPVLLDQRLAKAFTLNSDQLPQGSEKIEIRAENSVVAFSYFNPPISVEVTIKDKRLLYIKTPHFDGRVEEYSGVWKADSHWWDKSWQMQEWDVEVENNGVYRLYKVDKTWFLAGEYD
ncbi:MAG: hypothetical protein H7070_01970 [Saprospiraceae bacterium]|nr:hypothetical protein [Pyrinomonadaceae bacterium]